MHDFIEKLGRNRIHHGHLNNRLYLMKLDDKDVCALVERLEQIARKKGYGKIFAKIEKPHAPVFKQAGYIPEAVIPGFYQGRQTCLFVSKFLCYERGREKSPEKIRQVLERIKNLKNKGRLKQNPVHTIRRLTKNRSHAIAEFFEKNFTSYPFPVFDPEYVKKTMSEGVRYYAIIKQNRIVAASAAEIDIADSNAEMTDFATDPNWRSRGFARALLTHMEKEMINDGIKTAYTIARACSFGMNSVFKQNDFRFGGTLINNTHIAGGIESMNVWYKRLASET